MAQMVKRLPAMREAHIRSLGQEDPLEKEMATTPVLLPGKSQGQRNLVGYSPWGQKELGTTERLYMNVAHHFAHRKYCKHWLWKGAGSCTIHWLLFDPAL